VIGESRLVANVASLLGCVARNRAGSVVRGSLFAVTSSNFCFTVHDALAGFHPLCVFVAIRLNQYASFNLL
jgi:hypothetical protein